MGVLSDHLLSLVLFTPTIGALVLLFAPRGSRIAHRVIGNVFGVLGFAASLVLVWRFPAGDGDYQFIESVDWIPSIGAHYRLGLDGISLLLALLTTFLGMLAILSSWSAIQHRTKEYYILLLLLQTGVLGVFLSLDFFLFYVFWEVMLVPMYFLIGVWGGERRLYAAIKFFLYTLAGSVVMLLAILALYFNYGKTLLPGATGTFDIPTLLAAAQGFPDALKTWLFWGFFFAFAIKVAVFPFHTWLPDAHTEAPTAASVILAGVLLKTGTYGFLRFSLPLLPADPASRAKIIQILIVLSIVGIIYGAIVCLMQKDMKRLIAYSSISQLGFCTLGIFALTPQGLSGSVLQQINHGISTGALFLLFGVLYERRHTRLISDFGGLAAPMPNYAAIYLIMTLSALGLPLLGNFVGEITILQGAFVVNKTWVAWAVLGLILSAAYFLWLFQRVMLGQVTHEVNRTVPDLNLREFGVLIPLVFMAFWLGVYSKPFFGFIEKPVEKIVEQVNPGFYQHVSAASPSSPSRSSETAASSNDKVK